MEHKNDLDFNAKLYGKKRFGFRKISVGLAARALGTTFFLSNGQLVHADTENNNAAAASSVVEKFSQTTQDTKTQDNQSTLNNTGNTSEKEKAPIIPETEEHSTTAPNNTDQHSGIANDDNNITKSETTATEQND